MEAEFGKFGPLVLHTRIDKDKAEILRKDFVDLHTNIIRSITQMKLGSDFYPSRLILRRKERKDRLHGEELYSTRFHIAWLSKLITTRFGTFDSTPKEFQEAFNDLTKQRFNDGEMKEFDDHYDELWAWIDKEIRTSKLQKIKSNPLA